MTEYFEVLDRAATARLGELRLEDPVTTPALIGDLIEDAGSLWTEDRETPQGDESTITVLPHRATPPGTPEEVATQMQPTHDAVPWPSAAVVGVEAPEPMGQDCYVLAGVRDGDARRIVDRIVEARRALEPDAALVVPGIATPRNAATLALLGVDGLDRDHAAVAGGTGTYMTTRLESDIAELRELPCSCAVCRDAEDPDALDGEDVARHNVGALRAELANVRDAIRAGALRSYVEGQARHARWQVEALRLLDAREAYVDERWPVGATTRVDVTSTESMDRRDVQRFAERVVGRYRAPRSDVAVLLPCSARKPYSESQSHGEFRSAIGGRAHEVVLTSPIGVVPRELEQTYPAGHYDTPVTGRWTPTEIAFVGDVLADYFDRNRYDRVVAHLERDGYGDAVDRAVGRLGQDLDVTWTVEESDHPRDEASLDRLDDAVDGGDSPSREITQKWYARAVADYQFGESAFDDRFALGDVRIEGRLPRPRLWREDEQLATLTPEYGLLALTLAGADAFDPPTVTIDDFVPEGSVLAPGVDACPDGVRVGDEVAFEGPSARGVGRAKMFGEEMERATRGVAIDVRHLEEL